MYSRCSWVIGPIDPTAPDALAITSTRGWQQRLGKWWKRLQRLVYLANALAVLHFAWLLKEPRAALPYVAAVGVLLVLRVPVVARVVRSARRQSVKESAP